MRRLQTYRYLIVAVIWITFFFGSFDRTAISLLMVEQKRDYINKGRAAEATKSAGGGGDLSSLLHNYRFWLMVTYHFAVLATLSGLITWLRWG